MEALVPLMENASTLDWITLGAIAWLVYRDYLQKARIDAIKADLDKHEDMCVEFRRSAYARLGALERDTGILKDRHQRESKP